MKDFCEDLRTYYDGFVLCGGPYPTMDPDTVLAVEAVDAVCVGEGDDAICELADYLEKGDDVSRIRNLWVKTDDGTIVKNKLRAFKDLRELPPDDKELFDLAKILPLKNYQLETMVGRGCVYKCAYCINDSYVKQYHKYCEKEVKIRDYTRIKEIDTVIKEITMVVLKFPEIKKIAFIDDNFFMYPKFVEAFYAKYKEEVGLPFMCNINPMSFNESKGQFLKDAGCDDIRFGIESGCDRVKKEIMKRTISNESVVNAFNVTKKLGIMSSSFNMIGLPTETKEEALETLKINAEIEPDTIKLMTFYPFKNTPLYNTCEELKLINYDRKKELDDYDTFTCLNFPDEHQLFLKKMQVAFNWYINSYLKNEAGVQYKKLVDKIELMTADEWNAFDFPDSDKEISNEMKQKGFLHYSKFVNRSLAVKWPSPHLDS